MEVCNYVMLSKILSSKYNYSTQYMEEVFLDKKTIKYLINCRFFSSLYNSILNSKSKKLKEYYLSSEFINFLKDNNKLHIIYKKWYFDGTDIDVGFLFNEENLDYVGKEVALEYKKHNIFHWAGGIGPFDSKYNYFIHLALNKLDEEQFYCLLDYYLTHPDYLPLFRYIRKFIGEKKYHEYLESRRDLITKVIENSDNADTYLIIENEYQSNLLKDQLKGREKALINCDVLSFEYSVGPVYDPPKDKIILSDEILNHPKFISKFIDSDSNVRSLLKLVTDDDVYIDSVVREVEKLKKYKKEIINNLGDTKEEFKSYLQILDRSLLKEIPEFINDMIDVIFYNTRIEEVYEKYKNANLEKMKLDLLNNVIRQSRESIVSALTNPFEKKVELLDYKLDGKIVKIPTIIYDGDDYNFLIRRVNSGNYYYRDSFKGCESSYSIINEKNRSVFYGNSGVISGFITVNPEDITQINSFDAISQSQKSDKYVDSLMKYPEWVTAEKLNDDTLYNDSYNEIRIIGKYVPDFYVSFDEPNEKCIKTLSRYGSTLVKILRKNYPNAIEKFEDPYKDWK